MLDEIWKSVPGYERYQVSNMGNVRTLHYYGKTLSTKDNGVRILKRIINSSGYPVVSLHNNGKQKQFFVHRLVAELFVDNPNGLPVVDHINTDKMDNRAENLRWVTVKDNVNNPISATRRIGKCREQLLGRYGGDSPRAKRVIQKDLNGRLIRVWESMTDAWKELGLDSGCITHCCKGKYKSAGGFKWEYAE